MNDYVSDKRVQKTRYGLFEDFYFNLIDSFRQGIIYALL